MNERRYPFRLFMIGFITNIFLHYWFFIPGVVLTIIGIWVDWCLYAGISLLAIDIITAFVEQMKIRHTMLTDSDDEQFSKFQDAVSQDGDVFANIRSFVADAIEQNGDDEDREINSFIVDMCDHICRKCEYGDNIEKLNEHERVFYVTQMLEEEVNNGGFAQFFGNSSGDFSNELADAFTAIGALKTAEICAKALSVFDGNVPTGSDERAELLDSLDCYDVLCKCDDEFYKYDDNLNELNYAYIMEHRDSFEE